MLNCAGKEEIGTINFPSHKWAGMPRDFEFDFVKLSTILPTVLKAILRMKPSLPLVVSFQDGSQKSLLRKDSKVQVMVDMCTQCV